jgi:hypothetical protein
LHHVAIGCVIHIVTAGTLYKTSRNFVHSCKYHVVWCPKYCRPVLDEEVAQRQAELIELEVMPDHVLLLCEVAPQFGTHRLVASCVEGGRLDAGRARELWPGVDTLLQAASSLAKQPASGGHMPASFGLWPESEPVAWEAGANAAEVRDAVPVGGEPGIDCWTARTPCL